jgi:hypothetical protein
MSMLRTHLLKISGIASGSGGVSRGYRRPGDGGLGEPKSRHVARRHRRPGRAAGAADAARGHDRRAPMLQQQAAAAAPALAATNDARQGIET